jgi:hypothetical protein
MSRSILNLQSTGSSEPAERGTASSGISWANCNGDGGSWFTWGGCF